MNVEARKTAVVTGGAAGIGHATAHRLVAEGYRVCVLDVNGERAAGVAAALGPSHAGVACDVTNENAVIATVNDIAEMFGHIDVLVNNAGIGDQPLPTLEQSAHHFDAVLQTHLRGTFMVSRESAKFMIAAGHGAVVNISSIAGLGGIPTRNAYCAAKAGVVGMTRAMACEWARSGIRVNAVAPGYVRTDLVEELLQCGDLDVASLEARTPMGRLARPEEIADVICFLASAQASFITGTVLAADGGWTALGAPESALPSFIHPNNENGIGPSR